MLWLKKVSGGVGGVCGIDHLWTPGWMGADKSFDIKGVNNRDWGGRASPQFLVGGSKCKKILAKVEKNFAPPWNQISFQILNQGKGQSHYKTLQIVQKEKGWLCLKFRPFEPSIYVKEIYSKLQKQMNTDVQKKNIENQFVRLKKQPKRLHVSSG